MARERLLGYIFSILAAVAYGAVAVVIRFGIKEMAAPLVGAAISLISGTIILCFASRRELGTLLLKRRNRTVHFIYVGGLVAAIGQITFYLALSRAVVAVVAPLTGTYPLLIILLSHLFLQRLEKITLTLVLGSLLIVLGGAIVALA